MAKPNTLYFARKHLIQASLVEGVSNVDGGIRIDGSQYTLPTRSELERDSKPATDGQHWHRGCWFGRQ